MMLKPERAIEILDPTHREHYSELPDGMEQVNEACRMGMEALKAINPKAGKPWNYVPTNAEVLTQVLAEIAQNGADEDGFPNVEYEFLVCATQNIECPYIDHPLCVYNGSPDAYVDCDACKAHWLMEKWES